MPMFGRGSGRTRARVRVRAAGDEGSGDCGGRGGKEGTAIPRPTPDTGPADSHHSIRFIQMLLVCTRPLTRMLPHTALRASSYPSPSLAPPVLESL